MSIDEAYLDMTNECQLSGYKTLQEKQHVMNEKIRALRETIAYETGCTASAGISYNMLLARIATRMAKPNGQKIISAPDVKSVLSDFALEDLPGVGRKLKKRLEAEFQAKKCRDLHSYQKSDMQSFFGPKKGELLFNYIRGEDSRQVIMDTERKSVGAEISWAVRFSQDDQVMTFIDELSTEVSNRMKNESIKGKSITLKVCAKEGVHWFCR